VKLVTFSAESAPPKVGALGPDGIVDLSSAFPSMLALIDGGEPALARARELSHGRASVFDPSAVRLLAPLPEPRQFRDAMCFEGHYKAGMRTMAGLRAGAVGRAAVDLGLVRIPRVWYAHPTYYKANRFAVSGHGSDVLWPKGAKLMDYECEIAVVIGKTGKDIAPEHALSHVFGYTIFNDMSARDLQNAEIQASLGPAKGKDFDGSNVLGPCIVTPDELTDPYDIAIEARVDGELWTQSSTRDMYHRWDRVIAYVSQSETLYAGEVIGSGTVTGGCGLEQGRFLHDGARIDITASGIGTLSCRLRRP
jgi:2-keto-4-pentenoate hydratase/2-oxohepta-3-ene-1,7-dioic acid hydratase in catechol pathway